MTEITLFCELCPYPLVAPEMIICCNMYSNWKIESISCFHSFVDLFIKQHSEFYVDHPEKVDRNGKFISYALSHHFTNMRHKRDLNSAERRVYYKLNYKGREYTLNLTTNDNLLSNEYVLERHNRSLMEKWPRTSGNGACHLLGTVTVDNMPSVIRTAAISTCEGLVRNIWLNLSIV